ncbi:hypothetical protein E5D57_012701 [Metarhizium anisopliae]|nr:hypothetical protein E5D57_012701 [Metarhizium anisopliae]
MKCSLAFIFSFAAVCLAGPVEDAVAKPQPTQPLDSPYDHPEINPDEMTPGQVLQLWSGANITCKAVFVKMGKEGLALR